MHNSRLYIILIIAVLCNVCGFSYAQLHSIHEQRKLTRPVTVSHASARDSVRLMAHGLTLTADTGSLIHDVDFTVSLLPEKQVASLQSNMVNLTGGASAYRLLPHGEHFSTPAQLEIAYDPMLLPLGFNPGDIYTYYYNEEAQRWIKLERLGVDTINHVVLSNTTHFTDFVNAVVRTPDMPEVKAFVPTQISDLKDVAPLQNLMMIETPEANNYGEAQITYPIYTPSGRNGLQPEISLTYSSSSGNGLLGYGWSFPQSAITIDTRWGVPRYDHSYESEIYTINGMQCVIRDGNPNLKLPYQAHSLIERQNGDVVFIARDTRNCDRIIRHGNSPHEYWWEVIDREGKVSYYGKYANDTTINPNCILTDASGNIGYWALAEVVDIYGNYIKYEYAVSPSQEIYPKQIYYTGHRDSNNVVDLEPSYRVFFHYDQREDILRDGRLGFVRQTDSIMCYIDLTSLRNITPNGLSMGCQNRRYVFIYSNNSTTSLLTQIQDHINYSDARWATDTSCMNHLYDCDIENGTVTFDYFNPSSSTIFAAEDTLPFPDATQKSLNVSENRSWNIGGTATLGLGYDIWNTNLSAGGNYNYSQSSGKTTQMLMDMNGDGLADWVFVDRDTIFYYPQYDDTTGSRWGDAISTGLPSKGLSSESSKTHSWGLQAGVELYGVANANTSGGKSYTTSYTSSYFSDVNGDGLPDYVNDGKVYFNRMNTSNKFIPHSNETEVIIDSSRCTHFYYEGEVEVLPDYYVFDSIVGTYVYTDPDCSLGFYGTDPVPASIETMNPPSWVSCDSCDQYIIEYIQSGQCPIDLHSIFSNRSATKALRGDSAFVENPDTLLPAVFSLEERVMHCLLYCHAELPCEECLDYYHDPNHVQDYEQCKQEHGCRTLCSTCAHHLIEGDEQAYLTCMDDSCLQQALYTLSTPCLDCEQTCLDDINNCKECIYNNPLCMVCEECMSACTGTIEDCLECKMQNNCFGGHAEDCISDCYEHGYDPEHCRDCILNSGNYCEECLDTCLMYPELCRRCVDRQCYYDETEAYLQECRMASQNALNTWKQQIKQQYANIAFVKEGNTYYAHLIDTIYPAKTDPEIEAVRVWVAPKNGVVTLHSSIHLNQDTTASRAQSRQVDGVRCVIQHHRDISVDTTAHVLCSQSNNILGIETIDANDYSPRYKTYENISVKQGDVFFFQLRSVHTHNFDNVTWSQLFTYNDSSTYSSENDFICYSYELFQTENSGTINLNTDITCPTSSTGKLSVLVNGSAVDSVNINSSVHHSHIVIPYARGTSVSIQLSSAGDMGGLEVRPYLSFVPIIQDSVNQPYGMWISPHAVFAPEIVLDSTYYNLFGPLYKGWGQFGYNNMTSTDGVPIRSLCNHAVEYAHTTQVDSASFCQSIMFTEADTTQILQEGGLETAFSTRQIYNPLQSEWIQMTPDISQYRWEAYGRVARNGRTLLSNTRDTKAMLAIVGSEDYDITEEYDNEVPVSTSGQRITAVRKESKTTQWNTNIGAGVLNYGVGKTQSESDFTITSDFMDMNGDGYPDIVRTSTIQYTRPWGGLGPAQKVNASAYINHGLSRGSSISGSYGIAEKLPGGKISDGKFFAHCNGNIGANATTTNNSAAIAYIDINGDGLPDKLIRNNGGVSACLNIGYGFAAPYALPNVPMIDMNQSVCLGGSLGIGGNIGWGEIAEKVFTILGETHTTLTSKFQTSIAFGVDLNWSQNNLVYRLVDMNGDGIPEIVRQTNNGIEIAYSPPSGGGQTNSLGECTLQRSTTLNGGMNMGVTVGFPIWFFKVGIGINGSPVGLSTTNVSHDLVDMNGDGLPDLVWVGEDGIHVRYNQSGKNLLLQSATNPTGQKIQFEYELSAPTYEQRGRQWLLNAVLDIDPHAHSIFGCDTIKRTFSYSDPHYDYAERQFLGYGTIISLDVNTDTVPQTTYRKIVRHYNNQDFIEQGKLTYEGIYDSENHLYKEYEIGTMYVDSNYTPTDNLCNDASVRVGSEVHYTRYYEGGDDKIVTAKKYDYDKYHNVREYINFGDTLLHDDELRTAILYDSTSVSSHNLVSLPVNIVVYNNETPHFEIQADYRDGLLTELRRTDLLYAQSDTTNYHYDSFGLPDSLVMPANQNGERAYTAITYDAYSHTLPALISDQWGRTVQMKYDKFWQHPLIQKDVSGDSLVFTYDELGRVVALSVPGDTTQNGRRRTSLTYSYLPRTELDSDDQYPFTQMEIYIRQSSWGNLQNNVYCDSRGNLMYRREMRDDGLCGYNWIFSDLVKKDCFGRPLIQYHNYIETDGIHEELTIDSLRIYSQFSHDILDRPLRTSWQDGTQQTVNYQLGEDVFGVKRLEQVRTDERGGIARTYTAPQGWVTTSIMPNHTKTGFMYNALGQLLMSIDPDSMITTYLYDGFGRKRERYHPDAGITQWQYDNAGILIASATQAQLNDGTSTNYEYEYNRLKAIRQPRHPQLDVILEYDSIGRIANRKDITGCETFEYDALGNVAVSDRLMVLPSDTNGYRFRIEFTYDILGRIQSITYPDREQVTYNYHNASLYLVRGTKYNSAENYNYATYPVYDSYNRPVEIQHGGYTTNFEYDSNRQWLTHQTTQSNTHQLQDLYYTYDAIGNITSIEQQADSVHWLGGAYMLEYQYDSLNRLTKADMLSDYFGEYSDYTMTYSPSGMVGIKSCNDMLWNYWYGYHKVNTRLVNHQVRSIYDMENDATTFLMWDPSGRLQDFYNPCMGDLRHHWWNESDQLTAVADNGSCAFYGYDGNGERAYKLTGVTLLDQYNAGQPTFHMCFNNAVMYINPYMVVTPKGYTKHYYNGSQRLAAHIGELGDLPSDIIDTSSIAIERIANAKAYMDTLLLNQSVELNPDTLSSFADVEGDAYDELQWQCMDDSLIWHITMQCDSNMLLEVLTRDSSHIDVRVRGVYYYHPDHLGSATWITNSQGAAVEFLHYMPLGEMWYNQQGSAYNERFKFTGKERDVETGYDYFGARYYASAVPSWLSVDPLSDKYPSISPYAYCAWNPVMCVDPDGMVWTDVLGNEITDHSKIRAYIFYNPEEFSSQSFSMAIQLEMKYGFGTVALSSASTETEFAADWKAMDSPHIMEVDINHHGSNQAIHLDYKKNQYITSTGTGYTQSGRADALNVSDIGTPSGNISNAQLNLNTCHSNSAGSWLGNIRLGTWRIPGTSATLRGSNETLMQSFIHYFDFYSVRGTSAGVSYNKKTLQPEPQFFFQSWTYYYKGGRK